MKYCPLLFLLLISGVTQAQNDALSRGVYDSFEDYKAGHTAAIDSFYLDSVPREKEVWLGTYSVTPRFVKNDKKVRRIWGFFDGTRSWIAFQNDFFPLVVDNGNITFEAYGTTDNTDAAISALLFGPIGAGIYAVASNDETKGERVTYVLDSNNGLIYTADDLGLDLQGSGVEFTSRKLVIYRGTKKEMDAPMKFSVDDTLINNFVPGSYVEMDITSSDQKVDICFGTDFGDCETILFTGAVQYVECTFKRKAEPYDYQFSSVNQLEGEHCSVWSYQVQERRQKRQQNQETIKD